MAANYDLTALAVKMVCPNNEIIADKVNGYPSIYAKIPKCKMSDLITGGSTFTKAQKDTLTIGFEHRVLKVLIPCKDRCFMS